MRNFLSSFFYLAVLIILGYFAKDNLITTAREFFGTAAAPVENLPKIVESGSIEVAFSPNGNATKKIIAAIEEARKTILVAAYSFTSDAIAGALLDAKKRGVTVKIILDKSQVSQKYSSSTFFANMDFDLKIDAKHAIFHNKVMIIDDKTVVTGSFNFTKAAEKKNAENVLIIRNNKNLAQEYKKNWLSHWQEAQSRDELLVKPKKFKLD